MKPRLHFVVDPMGWLCISVVLAIWLYNSVLIPKLVLLPHYDEGHIPWGIVFGETSCPPTPPPVALWSKGLVIVAKYFCFPAGYYVASALCFAALIRASTADPGRLPTDPHIPHSGVETGNTTVATAHAPSPH